jgi:hypothetical protein
MGRIGACNTLECWRGKKQIKILIRNPEGKRPLGIHTSIWVGNIKMYHKVTGCEVNWIQLALDRDQRLALLNTVMKLRVP